jgi:hypothetical protein
MKLPGTGHANEYDTIVAHMNGIQSFDIALNQELIVSCGKDDYCIFIWKFDRISMNERQKDMNIESTIPMNELESLFYYVQLQDQNDLTIESTIALPLISDFTRGRGLHISQRQIQELYDEQCLKTTCSNPNEIKLSLYDTIRIYYNHFAHNTSSMTIDQILNSIFDEHKSLTTSTIDIHSLIQTLVSNAHHLQQTVIFIYTTCSR